MLKYGRLRNNTVCFVKGSEACWDNRCLVVDGCIETYRFAIERGRPSAGKFVLTNSSCYKIVVVFISEGTAVFLTRFPLFIVNGLQRMVGKGAKYL